MKTRLTLILVLLIYIGAASHTHAQQKKVIKTMMIAGAGRQPLLARRLRSHEADIGKQRNV